MPPRLPFLFLVLSGCWISPQEVQDKIDELDTAELVDTGQEEDGSSGSPESN